MGELQHKRSYRHSWWPPRPPWITLTSVLLLLVHSAHCSINCGSGIKSVGETIPRGDIVIEYGSGVPLEITCILDPDNAIVQSQLRELSDNENETQLLSQWIVFYKYAERVPKQYVSIINATAAQLRIPNPPAGLNIYDCILLLDKQRRLNDSYDTNSGAQLSTLPDDSSRFSTVQPTSLETSGPPPLMPQEAGIGVCLNTVHVGYKPLPIKNFSCISDNWASLTCNWTKPDNPIKTDYRLFFRLPGRASSRNLFYCPLTTDVEENYCYWDGSTRPIYRQLYENYYFTITGQNVLGNTTTLFRFRHYANVIPVSPNITVLDKTQSSAMLKWSVGPMIAFPKELIHKIEYKSQWDSNPEHWHPINVSYVCNSSLMSNQTIVVPKLNCLIHDNEFYYFNVTDLKYPFTHYDFRIYVRSSVASGEDRWSAPGRITLKTKPTIPRRPPKTDIGSFECVPSLVKKHTRDVFIYWQNIDDSEKCGDLFEYNAYYTSLTADNQTIIHRSNETFKNYAKFEGLNTSVGYLFTVYSTNKEGSSTDYSTVYVPSEADKLDEPISFTKMAFDERGVFELSWKNASSQKSSTTNQLSDYTIFWCENDKDRPYQCNGYMNWMHIPSSESCYNITVSDHMKIYQFAISSNSQNSLRNSFNNLYQPTISSSGMVWASCTVLHNKIVGKIKNVWINIISATHMELRWKLDCSDRIGAVLGFRIYYCPVVSINNSACKEPMLNKTISGENMVQDSKGSISNLKSYTTYMVTIALITKHGEGLHSNPLLNTTLEGAPDVHDLNISVMDFTNTSVTLQWSTPKLTNGIVRYYFIHYYLDDIPEQQDWNDFLDEQQSVNQRHRITVHDTKCHIEQLESYRTYNISVTACTTLCSNRSSPIQVQTAVGLPGRVSQPSLLYENSTRIVVSWLRPIKPAGPINYYQIAVVRHSGSTNSQTTNDGSPHAPAALASTQLHENPEDYYMSISNEFRVPVPDCNNEHVKGQQTFSFSVRAVNKNPMDPYNPYFGPWSVPGSVSCVLPGLSLALHLVIWSCLFIVLSTISTYWGNRFWRKYKVMHNVQVVLPPTLNINFKFDHFNFSDSQSDSGQHYYVEDGHIIYDTAPANGGVTYNANSKVSTSDGRNRSSSSCERLPPTRWSPATATTTTTVADDDDSSSSKQHLILPSTEPTACKSDSDGRNAAKGNDAGDDDDAGRPLEPVLPFFSLPEAPVVTRITAAPAIGTPRDLGSVTGRGDGDRGYQDSSVFRGSGVPRDDGATAGTSTVDCFVGDQRRSHDKNLLVRRRAGNSHTQPSSCDGGNDFPVVRATATAAAAAVAGGEHHREFQKKDYLPYQRLNNEPQQVHQSQIQEKLQQQQQQLQQQLQLQQLQMQQHQQQVQQQQQQQVQQQQQQQVQQQQQQQVQQQQQQQQVQQQQQQQVQQQQQQQQVQQQQQQVQQQQQQQQQQLQQQQQQQLQQQQLQLQQQQQQQSQQQQQQLQQQQQSRHDGYCGKQMMIVAAAAAAAASELGKNNGGGEQQQPSPTTLLASSTAYVMLDMVTAAAAQKRLLDLGRADYGKSVAVAQPVAVMDADGCGSSSTQREGVPEMAT